MRTSAVWLVLTIVACGGGDDDGDSAGATSQVSAPATLSAEDGPEPTCEPNGGTCTCVGGCADNSAPAPGFTCPQPPDSSGACSLDCCMPVEETASGTGTSATTTTASSSASASSMSGSGGGVCDCAALPVCATEQGEDCGGMYPEGRCCDESGAVLECSCIDPCTGGYPCCSLSGGVCP